jgi:uroporphyrin-III C-methyltransferase/precorrin-2 dehydrogenase/sirohydrochlorin ferrochelatase
MDHFPIFLKLRDRPVLVVGGSRAAAAKVTLLLAAGARVRLVARDPCPDLAALAATGAIAHLGPVVTRAHLAGCVLAFDDGRDAGASRRLARHAKGLPINTIDRPDACDFLVPAIVDRAPITIAIGTGGASPCLAKVLRQRLETLLPLGLAPLGRTLAQARERVRLARPQARARRIFWTRFLRLERLDALAALSEGDILAEVDRALGRDDWEDARVSRIRIRSWDVGQVTLFQAEALRAADTILCEGPIPASILALARRDARIIREPDNVGNPGCGEYRVILTWDPDQN